MHDHLAAAVAVIDPAESAEIDFHGACLVIWTVGDAEQLASRRASKLTVIAHCGCTSHTHRYIDGKNEDTHTVIMY